ncbi:MAG: 3'-5' exonuclease, partial [Candidatus Woesearchaeota archaeon]
MKGFIVYPTYRVENNKAYVWLFGRLENGESFLTINEFQPYFYVKKSDQKKLPEGNYKIEESNFSDFEGNKVIKIIVNIPKEVPALRKLFEDSDIICYEADIRFAYRFLIDNEIKCGIEIEGEHEKGEFVDRIYKEPKLKGAEFIPKLKVLSLDIETEPNGNKLYSIAIYGEKLKKAFLFGKKSKNAECFEKEEDLLEAFRKEVIKYDPDIITGWNLIDFDLKYLEERFRKLKIPFVLGRTEDKCALRIESNFIIDSRADFPGRAVLDGIQLLKTNFIKLYDYKLGTAAKVFLGERKFVNEKNKAEEIKEMYEMNPEKLIEYNTKDAKLVYDILEKTKIIEISIRRSLLTGMQLERIRATIASFDSLYLGECRKRNLVAVSVRSFDRTERIKGGYVMESKPGIYDYVLVLDFKSLYPSLIRTFNIDPYAYATAKKEKEVVETPNGIRFSKKKGILPEIIENLWKQRDKAKK